MRKISFITSVILFLNGLVCNVFADTSCTNEYININGEQKVSVNCLQNPYRKWEVYYDEIGRELYGVHYRPINGEWVMQEISSNYWSSNNQKTQYSYFCNGYRSGKMWGVYYYGPENGCTTEAFIQTSTNGQNTGHYDCSSNPTASPCVIARNRFCPPVCSSCSNGICSACFGDYMLQDNACVKACGDGYLTNSGKCMKESDCKDGFHADNGACVANSDVNCNTEIGGKCTECKNNTFEQDGSCVSSCDSGYKDMGGFCNRVRYTPAEAAAAANDDNTNVVTITFRK